MNAQTIRQKYLDFFKEKQHTIVPRALLVPYNDPTTLFTGSGMQPLIPYLLGETHPSGTRLVDSQTCLRSMDIDSVGNDRHTTFFEMLGNWSLGDYFKKEQIPWFFEFLVEVVGLDPTKLYVTCFIGDEKNGIPKDEEAALIWQKLFKAKGIDAQIADIGSQADGDKRGIKPGERIFYYDDGENWWSRGAGIEGTPVGDPCGPDSEVFYDFGDSSHKPGYGEPHPASDSGRFVEIGNQVFMQYKRTDSGFEKLAKPNVDFGGGLERIAQAAIDSSDMFRISILWPIIEQLQVLSGKKYESHRESMQVISDHLRAATYLAVDGVSPSNKEQGYVMRRLIRRALRQAFDLGIEQNFLEQVVPVITALYESDYPEVAKSKQLVIDILIKEEKVFRQTLRKGIQEFQKLTSDGLSGEEVFKLYDTYGFPVELSVEEAFRQDVKVDEDWKSQFDAKMKEQRERSQTAAKGTFKGGLGGQTQTHKMYHTATHLMYQALRDVLGDHVVQNGSNITEERLRFDFSHHEKVTPQQIKQVEDIVNEQIKKHLVVTWKEYPTNVAVEEKKALGQFGDRYGDVVKVYNMQAEGTDEPFSFEICGGPHVDNTKELESSGKSFKILKEEASSAGIRRIKAALV